MVKVWCNTCNADIPQTGYCMWAVCPHKTDMETKGELLKWCANCQEQVTESEAKKCLDSRCMVKSPEATAMQQAEIKYDKLECKQCGLFISPGSKEKLQMAVDTCKKGCSQFRDLLEFTKRIEDKKDGKSKNVPMLLTKQPNLLATPNKVVSGVLDTSQKFFEIEVDDPIYVFVHKNGHVENRSTK